MKICEYCHKEFKPNRKEQRFCSNTCSGKANSQRQHISGVNHHNYGRKASEETRQKISRARIGLKHSEETRKKMSDDRKGKPKSEAWRLAISLALKESVKVRNDGILNPNYKTGEYIQERVYRELIDLSRCSTCGTAEGVIEAHHKDGNHLNHRKDNLQALCRSCHGKLHHPKGKQFGPKRRKAHD